MQTRRPRGKAGSRAIAAMWVLLGLTTPLHARAQQTPEHAVQDLNGHAMEAYNALDINRAGSMLEEALRIAYEHGVTPGLLARTHVNMGIVLIGGISDHNAGLESFVQAVCIDPNIQLDPLTSTPEIQNIFGVALERARAGACPTGAAAPQIAPEMAAMPPPPEQALAHYSPPEQLTQTPLPLYVEINPLARAKKILLVYRGIGMQEWKRVAMFQYQNGFAYQISCNDVWEPKVSYYIEAQDESGRVVGMVGSAAQPIEVPVVAARTQPAPALPGAVPPESCAARECPPGMDGCEQPGTLAIGEECSENAQCQSGLECEDDACRLIGAGSTEVPEYDPETGTFEYEDIEADDPSAFKPTYLQVGFTLGFSYVQAGMAADRSPPDNRVFVDGATGNFVEDPYAFLVGTGGVCDPVTGMGCLLFAEPDTPYEPRLTAWVPDADSSDSKGSLEGNCSADGEVTGPTQANPAVREGLLPSRYCVRVRNPGFVPNMALRAAIGHFLTPEFALAAIFRFQFEAGQGTLPNMLVGARAEYMLTSPSATGLMISAFAGGTFGQIQAKPPATEGSSEGAPFVRSGLFGAHLGATVRYRFSPHFGLYAAPEVDVQLPSLLFNVDLTVAGIEAAF